MAARVREREREREMEASAVRGRIGSGGRRGGEGRERLAEGENE